MWKASSADEQISYQVREAYPHARFRDAAKALTLYCLATCKDKYDDIKPAATAISSQKHVLDCSSAS